MKVLHNIKWHVFVMLFSISLLVSCNKDIQDGESKELTKDESIVVPKFNADSAYLYLEKQLAFGPRNPGSNAHRHCSAFLQDFMQQYADITFASFFSPEIYGSYYEMKNICASFNQNAKERILLCAHWDSRPYADEDPDKLYHKKPILGANDGASGVAILMEIARVLSSNTPEIGVDIILFDGEDFGKSGDLEYYFLGSKQIANSYPFTKPKYAILLDLVGDKDAQFRFEPLSMQVHAPLMQSLWDIAKSRGYSSFIHEMGNGVSDDHIPLNEAGIKTIDIIDVNLVGHQDPNPRRKYWHTSKDSIDNIGKSTLDQVGNTILEFIYTKAPLIF